jgi:hypothetical protein
MRRCAAVALSCADDRRAACPSVGYERLGNASQRYTYLKPFTAKLLAADKWIQRDAIALGVAGTSIRCPGGAYPLSLPRCSLATGDNTECEKKRHRNIVTHRTAPLATAMQSNTRERSPSSPSKVGDIREAAPSQFTRCRYFLQYRLLRATQRRGLTNCRCHWKCASLYTDAAANRPATLGAGGFRQHTASSAPFNRPATGAGGNTGRQPLAGSPFRSAATQSIGACRTGTTVQCSFPPRSCGLFVPHSCAIQEDGRCEFCPCFRCRLAQQSFAESPNSATRAALSSRFAAPHRIGSDASRGGKAGVTKPIDVDRGPAANSSQMRCAGVHT